MPRFAANLSMLYNDVDFLDRFAAAARDGFKAVEYLFPYAYPAQELAARLWLLCQPRPTPLTEPQIEELRQAFGAQW